MKGIAYINKIIQYRIHATDRIDEKKGLIIADLDMDEFESRITVYESGKAVIRTSGRTIEVSLTKGELICE
jgi:hypothetical protein